MANTLWSKLTPLQLGRYAEYYAKMEFASFGFQVFTSEVDDHGVDFIVKHPADSTYFHVQVKSIRNTGYVFANKDKLPLRENWILCLLRFVDNALPDVYMIPAMTWTNPYGPFVSREYGKEGQKSKPEWGINVSKKHLPVLEQYCSNCFFSSWL